MNTIDYTELLQNTNTSPNPSSIKRDLYKMDHPNFILSLKQTFTREELNYVYILERQKLVNLWVSKIKTKVIETTKKGDTNEHIYVFDSETNKDELGRDLVPDVLKKLQEIFPDSTIEFREDYNRIVIDWSMDTE